MSEASIISRLRSVLHERLDFAAKEPLPERWVDLINELNVRERRDEELLRNCDPRKDPAPIIAKCSRPNLSRRGDYKIELLQQPHRVGC